MFSTVLTNVCTDDFVKSITCNAAVNKQHPVEHLLHQTCKSGFMVDRFVKQPATVTIEFKKRIFIDNLRVGLSIGAQQTTSLQVFAGHEKNFLKKVGVLNLAPNEKLDCVDFRRKNTQEQCSLSHRTVFFQNVPVLDRCQFLALNITRANYVPCLKFIEIYSPGIPSMETPSTSQEPNQSGSTDLEKSIPDAATIPDDFLDALTCELMILPVTLPSGKNIDKSTLEKLKMECFSRGQTFGDPFTGVKIARNSAKPVANLALKQRIDKFFVDNTNLAHKFNIGRTTMNAASLIVMMSQRNLTLTILILSVLIVSSMGDSNHDIQLKRSKRQLSPSVALQLKLWKDQESLFKMARGQKSYDNRPLWNKYRAKMADT